MRTLLEQSRLDSTRAIKSRLNRLEEVRTRERNSYRVKHNIPLDLPIGKRHPRWY